MPKKATIELLQEFLALCKADNVEPELVLRSFITNLAEIHNWTSNPRKDGYM